MSTDFEWIGIIELSRKKIWFKVLWSNTVGKTLKGSQYIGILSKKRIVGTRFSLTRSWTIRPRPKKSHTKKFVEYGLKNSAPVGSNGSLHVLSGCRSVNQEKCIWKWKFYSWICSHTMTSSFSLLSPPLFSVPLFGGLLHMI